MIAPVSGFNIFTISHLVLDHAKEHFHFKWFAVFLACRPINNQFENLGRETFMMPVKWSEDGFPYMTQGDDLVPMIVKREGAKRDTTVTYGNFELIENFLHPIYILCRKHPDI